MKYIAVAFIGWAGLACGACGSSDHAGAGDAGAGAGDAGAANTDAAPAVDAGPGPGPDAAGLRPDASPAAAALVAARPYMTEIPPGYDAGTPTPLVVLLHGYGASGAIQAQYFGLITLADTRGFLLAYPDGTLDSVRGYRFWDATDACCNFTGVPIDDVAYVNAIIDDMSARYNVDPKRIYLVGHSNGGFMSHRAACELSPRIAGIAVLAGDNWKDASRCQPTSPVAVLQVHGDADMTIMYDGGDFIAGWPPYPSAHDTVATWAARNGCGTTLTPGDTIDLVVETSLPGAETQKAHYDGCRAAVELWTIRGGVHIPQFNASWPGAIYDFLAAHPKP